METNQEMLKLMKRQAAYARIQCFFSILAAVCIGVLLIALFCVWPQMQQLAGEVHTVAVHAETVLDNLETVTEELAKADLAEMVNDVDTLVASSQTGVEQALEKIDAIDIDALNKAIKNLADVVEPLARFFNTFG